MPNQTSDYYETDRYPGPRYVVPSREEVEHFFLFAEQLYSKIEEFILSCNEPWVSRLHKAQWLLASSPDIHRDRLSGN